MSNPRIFLLSPAFAGGKRAELLLRDGASFPLARRIRSPERAALGDVYAFLSGLYFRGKMAYVRAFARPLPDGLPGAFVITPTRGLMPVDAPIDVELLREFADGEISADNPGYRGPLEMHARVLREHVGDECDIVLLGSIATGKYVDVLTGTFGERLLFPAAFVGRGDMSRGGLMLRAAESGEELEYVPVLGARRRGSRPPKLEPRRWKREKEEDGDPEGER
ncbi:MAG TPA: hypothetical protein VFR81_24125 [Longimicrobium sp.]|nr:hypothetical protein [Longimicrobium sp.]